VGRWREGRDKRHPALDGVDDGARWDPGASNRGGVVRREKLWGPVYAAEKRCQSPPGGACGRR
jgi:hypothetical protein